MTLAELHALFQAWLLLPSPEPIDVALATVLANRLAAEPLWIMLVGSPSSGKTEIITALRGLPDVHPLTKLTPSTFASGWGDPYKTSLLPKIKDKILTLKDFTTILTLHRESRAEIFAQLREIYDGAFKAEWGTGKSLEWEGKVGLLAGCTPEIDRQWAFNAVLGERFVFYRMAEADRAGVARRAIEQTGQETGARKAIREGVKTFLYDRLPILPPAPPNGLVRRIVALANFAAKGRSGIYYDVKGQEVDYIPPPEGPGRLAKQLYLLLQSLAVVRGHPVAVEDGDDFQTVSKVALDSIPPQRRRFLEELRLADPLPRTTTQLSDTTGYPAHTVAWYLEQLAGLRLVDKESRGQGVASQWRLSEESREFFRGETASEALVPF